MEEERWKGRGGRGEVGREEVGREEVEGERWKGRGERGEVEGIGGMGYIYTNLFQIIIKLTEEHVIIL